MNNKILITADFKDKMFRTIFKAINCSDPAKCRNLVISAKMMMEEIMAQKNDLVDTNKNFGIAYKCALCALRRGTPLSEMKQYTIYVKRSLLGFFNDGVVKIYKEEATC